VIFATRIRDSSPKNPRREVQSELVQRFFLHGKRDIAKDELFLYREAKKGRTGFGLAIGK